MSLSVVYFIRAGDRIKIGVTTDMPNRLMTLQTGSPTKLYLVGTIPGDFQTEKQLHDRFASARAHGEWFNLSGELSAFLEDVKAGRFPGWPQAGYVKAETVLGRLRMTPEQFFRWLEHLYGYDWPSMSAKVLGVHRITLYRWKLAGAKGKCYIPSSAVVKIAEECQRQTQLIKNWIVELKSDLSPTGDTHPEIG